MAELFQDQNIIAFPQTLAPAKRFPIIGNRIFGTLKEAQAYVDEIVRGTAVPGIILSVIADGDNNGAYWVSKAAGYDGAEKGVLLKINWSGSSNPVVGMLNDLTDVSISNPSNGQFLIYDSSLGVWTNKAFSIALASSSARGGIKVGFSAKYQNGSYYSIPVELDSEKAFVKLTKTMVSTALGFTPVSSADIEVTKAKVIGALGYTPFDAADFTQTNIVNALGFFPMASSSFNQYNIRDVLGISNWALASSKPSYVWSEIGSKPTTLSGYGIADAYTITQIETRFNNTAIYSSYIDISNNDAARHIGYGYPSIGWHGSGPAMSFGVAAYNLRMQLAIEASDTPRIMVSQVYNGTAYGWAELLTKEVLAKNYLMTAGYKCYDQMVLHKLNGGDTFVNYGGATNESNSLQLYYGTSFVVSLKGQSVMTMANNGNARFYKDLRVDGTLMSNTIYGDAPSGANYYRYRMIMLDGGLYLQASTYDGLSNEGNITLSGFGGVAANSISFKAKSINIQGSAAFSQEVSLAVGASIPSGQSLKIGQVSLSWDATNSALSLDNSLSVQGVIDSTNYRAGGRLYEDPTSSFCTTIFGDTGTSVARMRLMRTGAAIDGIAAAYTPVLAMRAYDTHSFLAISYNNKSQCYIGGGTSDSVTWSAIMYHNNMDLVPKWDNSYSLGDASHRWKEVHAVSIKIGDAVISWDAVNERLVISKGIYSTGAITAGSKS